MQDSGESLAGLDRFKRWMAAERKSKYTVKQYTFFVRMFLEQSNKPLESINETDIEDFKEFLAISKVYSKSTQYTCIKAIHLFYKSRGLTPPRNLTVPKRSRKVPVYLTEDETRRILDQASGDSRNYAIMSVLAYTGLRIGELCSLNTGDIDLEEDTLFVRSGKGDKDRMVIMTEGCSDALGSYLKLRKDVGTKALFLSRTNNRLDPTSVQRMVRKTAEEAGIEKHVTPHVLRHTFATTILRNGGDIRFIQKLLGHTNIATTEVYTHIDDSTLKKMYSKFKPSY